MMEDETLSKDTISASPAPQTTGTVPSPNIQAGEGNGQAEIDVTISKEEKREVEQEEEPVSGDAPSLEAPSVDPPSVDPPLSQDAGDDASETQANVPTTSCSETNTNPSSVVKTEEQDFANVKIKEEKDDGNDEAPMANDSTENTAMESEYTQEEHDDTSSDNISTMNTAEYSKDSEDSLINTDTVYKDQERPERRKSPSECSEPVSETSSEKLRNIRSARVKERIAKILPDGYIGTKPKIQNVRPGFIFEPGIKLEAMDYLNNWYAAKIVHVDWDAQEVQIHFEGWNSRYDEWVDFFSERLRPVPRQSNRKDSFSEGQHRRNREGEQVLARWTDCRFYPAQIISSNNNGSYQVLFYDGIKKNVQSMNIRDIPPSLQDKKAKDAAYEKEWSRANSRRKMERSQSFEGDCPTAHKRRLSGNNTPVQSKRVRHESTSPRLKVTTPPLETPSTMVHSSGSSATQGSSPASSNTSISSSIGSPITPVLSQVVTKKTREPLITDKGVGLLRDPTRKIAPKEMVIDLDHNKYKCDIAGCSKAFRKGSLLDYHKKYYHIGAKPCSWASAASKALSRSRKRLSTPGAVTGVKKTNTPQPAKVQRLRSSAPASISSKSAEKIRTPPSKPSSFAKLPVSPTQLKSPLPAKVKVSERLKAQTEKGKEETIEKKESKPIIKKPLEKPTIQEKTSEKGKTVEKGKTTEGTKDTPESEKILIKEKPKSSDALRTRRVSGKEEKSESKIPDKKNSEKVEDRKKSTDKIEKEKDRLKESERSKGDKVKSNDKYRSSSSSDRGRSTDKDRSEHRSSRHHHEKHKKSHKSHRHRDRDSDGSYKYSKKEEKHHRKESSYISQTEEIYVRELTSEQKMEMETSEEGVQTEEVYGDEVVHCVCKMNEEDGFMIQCDSCFCWQHSMCVGLNQGSVPKKYICCFCQNPSGERTNAKYHHNQEWFKTGELPQFAFVNDRSHNESPTMMMATHKLASDIHGVNEMLQGLRQKLKILQSQGESNPELKMWNKWYGPKHKTEQPLDFENIKLTPSMVETPEEIDSSVDSSIHEESMQSDIIKTEVETNQEDDDPMEVDINKETLSKMSDNPAPIKHNTSKFEDAVATNVSLESSVDDVIKLCDKPERKDDEAPCESTGTAVSADNIVPSSENRSNENPQEETVLRECPPDVGDKVEATSVSLNETSKEQTEEEMDVDVMESDNDDEPLSNLKEKWKKRSKEDHKDDPETVPSEESQCKTEIESPADGSKGSGNELELKKTTEDVEPHAEGSDKDSSVTPSNTEEKIDQDMTGGESEPMKDILKDNVLQDTSINRVESPETSEESGLKEKDLKEETENDLEKVSDASKQPDSVPTSVKTPIQSSDVPSTSRNIPDIPVISTPIVSMETEELTRLDCELNLLDHVTGIQDDLEERLALIDEQVTALESVQMVPQDNTAFKDSFDDMPLVKRHLKMLMADLKKVCEIVTT